MGILNVTPDSFSDGGLAATTDAAVARAWALRAEGADILDIGGESTRPGAAPVSPEEEAQRVLPVLRELQGLGIPLSLDSRRADVVMAALDVGIDLVNDVDGFRSESMRALLPRLAGEGQGVCVMHMQGVPATMQANPQYQDVVAEVFGFLGAQAVCLENSGLPRESILLDPGFGFGKTYAQNQALFQALPSLASGPHGVLVGVSRKRMMAEAMGRPSSLPAERDGASAVAALLAAQAGALVLRVHDVASTATALRVGQALTTQRSQRQGAGHKMPP